MGSSITPFAFSVLGLIYIIIAINLFKLFYNINILGAVGVSDIILLATFIVIIFYTYYTYKLATISIIYPAMLFARKEHTKDLKNFLSELKSTIKPNQIYDEAPKKEHPINPITQKCTDWRYKDLIENHLPSECEKRFQNACEEFEKKLNTYNKTRNNLYEKIRLDIRYEIRKRGLEEECYTNIPERRSTDFAVLCYKQYMNYFGRSKELYFKNTRDTFVPYNVPATDISELHFQCVDGIYTVAKSKYNLQNVSSIEEIYSDMLFNKEKFDEYKELAKVIIDGDAELDALGNKLKKMIEFLMRYPLFKGTKCCILQDLYKDNDLGDF